MKFSLPLGVHTEEGEVKATVRVRNLMVWGRGDLSETRRGLVGRAKNQEEDDGKQKIIGHRTPESEGWWRRESRTPALSVVLISLAPQRA